MKLLQNLQKWIIVVTSIFVMSICCSANEKDRPSVEVLVPKNNQIVRMGQSAIIRWRVTNLSSSPKNWKIYVDLSGCHEGMGTANIYSGAFKRNLGEITWTPPESILHAQQPGYAPDMRWYIRIYLYDGNSGHDEEFAMARSCHAAGGEWLVSGGSKEPVIRIEP